MPPQVTRPILRSKLAVSLMRSECIPQLRKVTAMMSLVIIETKDSFRLSMCPLTGYVGGPWMPAEDASA